MRKTKPKPKKGELKMKSKKKEEDVFFPTEGGPVLGKKNKHHVGIGPVGEKDEHAIATSHEGIPDWWSSEDDNCNCGKKSFVPIEEVPGTLLFLLPDADGGYTNHQKISDETVETFVPEEKEFFFTGCKKPVMWKKMRDNADKQFDVFSKIAKAMVNDAEFKKTIMSFYQYIGIMSDQFVKIGKGTAKKLDDLFVFYKAVCMLLQKTPPNWDVLDLSKIENFMKNKA